MHLKSQDGYGPGGSGIKYWSRERAHPQITLDPGSGTGRMPRRGETPARQCTEEGGTPPNSRPPTSRAGPWPGWAAHVRKLFPGSVFQAGAVGQVPGPNFGRQAAQN
jgi:hypothetical protein